jgi:hypothetical protein
VIFETVISTRNPDGGIHLAPMGIRRDGDRVLIAPFRPSTTLDNLLARGQAVVNVTDDVRVIAGCLTGRADWPMVPARCVDGKRLAQALSHEEVEVERVEEDPTRPRFRCRVVHSELHRPFLGFNRAQAAVVEAAILVSRLHLLPADKIDREMKYLGIAVDKTAGTAEREAWRWLCERIDAERSRGDAAGDAA